MSVEEIAGDIDVLDGAILEEKTLDLHQNSTLEKVDRVIHTTLQHMQDVCIQGVTNPLSVSCWTKGMWQGSPVSYFVDKVVRFVAGLAFFFPVTIARVVYAPLHRVVNYFHTNEFFYCQGERREFKQEVDNFMHWSVDLNSQLLPHMSELPFNERIDPVIETLRKQNSDIVFLSHVNRASASYLYEGIKDKYTDFFLDVGQKKEWSINGGMLIASRVKIEKAPQFYRLDLHGSVDYRGGFFVFETAEQVFIVTDFAKGKCPLMQDCRADAIKEIVGFLKQRDEQESIDKDILIVGSLSFSDDLEVKRLQDSVLENNNVLVQGDSTLLRVLLDSKPPHRHHSDLSRVSDTQIYASIKPFDTFTLSEASKMERDDTDSLEDREVVVEESGNERVQVEETHQDRKEESIIIYPQQEAHYSDLGERLADGVEPVEQIYTGQGKKESEVIREEVEFTSSGSRPIQDQEDVEGTVFVSSGERPHEAYAAEADSFEAQGEKEKEAVAIGDRLFEAQGKLPKVEKPIDEQYFEGIGAREEEKREMQEAEFVDRGEAFKEVIEMSDDFTAEGSRPIQQKEISDESYADQGSTEKKPAPIEEGGELIDHEDEDIVIEEEVILPDPVKEVIVEEEVILPDPVKEVIVEEEVILPDPVKEVIVEEEVILPDPVKEVIVEEEVILPDPVKEVIVEEEVILPDPVKEVTIEEKIPVEPITPPAENEQGDEGVFVDRIFR